MPNHCYQQVEIYGPRFLVKELYDNLSKEEPQFCQFFSEVVKVFEGLFLVLSNLFLSMSTSNLLPSISNFTFLNLTC